MLAHVSGNSAVGAFARRRLAWLYPLHVFALAMFALLQLGKRWPSAGFATRQPRAEA